MAQTALRGSTQIQSGTLPLSALVSGYSIPTANLADGANFIKKDGSVVFTGNVDFGGFRATNGGTPTAGSDFVTKAYADALINGVAIHIVDVVAVANLTLSGLQTIDGYTVTASDVVLLTAQSTASQNGPWVPAVGAWARPTWWAAAAVIPDGHMFLTSPDGTTYKNTKWLITTTGNITVDTTSVTLVQDLSGTVYTNGAGLNLVGSTFSVIYGTGANTAAQGNDSRITGALQTSSLGANVQTALGVAVGSAGAVLVNGGVLGTPSSGTLTNCSGLPTTGLTGTLQAAQVPAFTGGDVTSAGATLTLTVNHTAGSGFLKYTDVVFNETPSGTINGVNATFTIAAAPQNSSLQLYMNGVLLEPGAGNDYTISGTTITMLMIPQTGDKLRAYYNK